MNKYLKQLDKSICKNCTNHTSLLGKQVVWSDSKNQDWEKYKEFSCYYENCKYTLEHTVSENTEPIAVMFLGAIL